MAKKKGKKCQYEGGGIHGYTRETITLGCGKGRKCDISLYILPQGSTQEYFNEYTAERLETIKQDSTGGDKW